MRDAYVQFLDSDEPSIVEIFDGYRPPTSGRRSPTRLDPKDVVQDVGSGSSLSCIPSRFDFSDKLVSAVNPDPQVLARFLADHFQSMDLVLIDCPPTESVFTRAAYHASRFILVPVRPEYFATVGFPLLAKSLESFRSKNPTHKIDVIGVVINNGTYDGSNNGGPEKRNAMQEICAEAKQNGWHLFKHEIPYSRGFPKLMRGDRRHTGNSWQFEKFAKEFFDRL